MPKVELTPWGEKNLSVPLVEKVDKYFKNPDNEKRFREWYELTYGKPVPQGV